MLNSPHQHTAVISIKKCRQMRTKYHLSKYLIIPIWNFIEIIPIRSSVLPTSMPRISGCLLNVLVSDLFHSSSYWRSSLSECCRSEEKTKFGFVLKFVTNPATNLAFIYINFNLKFYK